MLNKLYGHMARHPLVWLFCAAFAVRLAAIVVMHRPHDIQTYEYGAIAHSLLEGQGYSGGAWYVAPAPTAFMTPVFPFLLAGCERFLPGPYFCLKLINAAVFCLAIVLMVPWLSALTNRRCAWLTALVVAFDPFVIIYVNVVLPLSLAASFLMAALWALDRSGRSGRPVQAVQAGALAGVGMLTEPAILFGLTGYAAGLLVHAWRGKRLLGVTRQLLLAALVCGLVISPWAVRNRLVLGRWIPFKNVAGLNLWQGNHPGASGAIFTDDGRPVMEHLSQADLSALAAMNECEMNDWFAARAMQFIRNHPGPALELYVKKLLNFYNPFPRGGFRWKEAGCVPLTLEKVRSVRMLLLLVGAAAGGVVAWRRRYRVLPLAGALIVPPLVYAAFHLDNTRYRFPYELIMIFFVCLGVEVWVGNIAERAATPRLLKKSYP